jgi:hypothetical protein
MKEMIRHTFFFAVLVFIPLPLSAIDTTAINQAIRNKGAGWVAGETSVSNLSPEEIRHRLMPIQFLRSAQQVKAMRADTAPIDLPLRFDWRNNNGHKYVTPVRDQGSCGSCWAFANTAALEARVLITSQTPDKDLDLSEQAIVSCDGYNYGCDGGWNDLALNYLQATGIPAEIIAPYSSGKTGKPGSCYALYKQNTYRISGYADAATSVESIKSALVQYGPLVTSFTVYTDFFSYKSGIYSHVTGEVEGGHAVAIVGYDSEDQSWIIKNSWGSDWGENGYFKIKAGTNECGIEEAVFVVHFATVPGTSFILNPANSDFGTLLLPDQQNRTIPFSITNNGSEPLANISYKTTNSRYSVSSPYVSTLRSTDSATIQVSYAAQAGTKADSGELQVAAGGVTRKSSLTARTNTRPVQPKNRRPSNKAQVSTQKPITLTASLFLDNDGDSHAASQWILRDASGNSIYYSPLESAHKTSITIPSGILQTGTQYYWQVLYQDSRGALSPSSVLTSFITTGTAPSDPNCFIATAAYDSPMAGQVVTLRQFRDRFLLSHSTGRKFVAWYYRNSPTAAAFIKNKPWLKAAVRLTLYPLIGISFLLISGYFPYVITCLLLTAVILFRFRIKMRAQHALEK